MWLYSLVIEASASSDEFLPPNAMSYATFCRETAGERSMKRSGGAVERLRQYIAMQRSGSGKAEAIHSNAAEWQWKGSGNT